MDYYANAIGAEPGIYWRMVSRPPGCPVDTPTGCLESVRWTGGALVGMKWMKLWSCEGHVDGLEDVRRLHAAR